VSSAATVFAILASAVIVAGGLAALVRALWRIVQNLRDNTAAIEQLTSQMGKLMGLDARVAALEEERRKAAP
jgi:outer membrane murein-binding lipoprotein Lpp